MSSSSSAPEILSTVFVFIVIYAHFCSLKRLDVTSIDLSGPQM